MVIYNLAVKYGASRVRLQLAFTLRSINLGKEETYEKLQSIPINAEDLNPFKDIAITGKDGKPKIVNRKTREALKQPIAREADPKENSQ
jgi:hypothetical protein